MGRAELEQWLRRSFSDKDQMLSSFYSNYSGSSGSDYSQCLSDWPPIVTYERDVWNPLVVTFSYTLLVSLVLISSSWIRWMVVLFSVICIGATIFGGWDRIELELHSGLQESEIVFRR